MVLVAFRTVRLPLVCLGHCQRTVGRSAVDNQVLHLFVGLMQHAVERPLQHCLGVIGDGDNRETYHSLLSFLGYGLVIDFGVLQGYDAFRVVSQHVVPQYRPLQICRECPVYTIGETLG